MIFRYKDIKMSCSIWEYLLFLFNKKVREKVERDYFLYKKFLSM